MSPVFDVWRVDCVGFLDRIEANVEASCAKIAIRNCARADNGSAYTALPSDMTARTWDCDGRPCPDERD